MYVLDKTGRLSASFQVQCHIVLHLSIQRLFTVIVIAARVILFYHLIRWLGLV